VVVGVEGFIRSDERCIRSVAVEDRFIRHKPPLGIIRLVLGACLQRRLDSKMMLERRRWKRVRSFGVAVCQGFLVRSIKINHRRYLLLLSLTFLLINPRGLVPQHLLIENIADASHGASASLQAVAAGASMILWMRTGVVFSRWLSPAFLAQWLLTLPGR
jgi:hypothetical protein